MYSCNAFSTASLLYIYVRSSLCWTPLHGWLSESETSTALRRLCVTTFTGFLSTSESSSNYVCSCSNVNTGWHHHAWHRCGSSCRPTHVVVSYDQRLVMIFWSHTPGLPATVHVSSPCPARRAEVVCRRNWSLLHWNCSSSVTDSKLYCFLVATRERCSHDFFIRSRGHKLIL